MILSRPIQVRANVPDSPQRQVNQRAIIRGSLTVGQPQRIFKANSNIVSPANSFIQQFPSSAFCAV